MRRWLLRLLGHKPVVSLKSVGPQSLQLGNVEDGGTVIVFQVSQPPQCIDCEHWKPAANEPICQKTE